MTTLEQIIQIKKIKCGIPLTDNEYIKCFEEWLQQKQKESEYPCWAKTITEEYLKELEKKVND